MNLDLRRFLANCPIIAWRAVNGVDAECDQRCPDSETEGNRFSDEEVAQ